MGPHPIRRQILTFIDKTVIPYGDNFEYIIEVMTARVQIDNLPWEWETYAQFPDGTESTRVYESQEAAADDHHNRVQIALSILNRKLLQDQMLKDSLQASNPRIGV